jgi:cysteine-rich repeat protein
MKLRMCSTLVPIALAIAACGGDDDNNMPPPNTAKVEILSFTANPTMGMVGGMSTLSWETKNATRVRVLRDSTELTMSTAMTGMFPVTLTDETNTFTLEASKDADVVTKTVTIMATRPPMMNPRIVSFSVAPSTWSGAEQTVTVLWNTQNAATISLSANGNAVSGFPGTPMGSFMVTITETTEFVLTAEGNGMTVMQTKTSEKFGNESEPNDSAETAQPITLTNGQGEAQGTISPEGDRDWYAIQVPPGGNVIAGTLSRMGNCDIDTVLELVDPNGEVLGENDDVNYGQGQVCSEINAIFDDFARSLAGGTYYLVVRGYEDEQGSVTGEYVLTVEVRDPGCGNQIKESAQNEECDDGNTGSNDGCDSSCQAEISDTISGPPASQTISGSLAMDTSRYIELTVTSTAWLRAQVFVPTSPTCTAPDNDSFMLLYDAAFEVIAGNDDIDFQGGITCSRLDPNIEDVPLLAPGTYYLQVLPYPGTALTAFEVSIELFAPGCGNGVIEGAEVCDDANTTAGDGCDATCIPEPVAVVNPPGLTTDVVFRSETDVQAYEIHVTTPGQAITATIGDGMDCEPYPTLLVFDANWTELGRSEPFVFMGQIYCPELQPAFTPFAADLAPGTYYLVVSNAARFPATTMPITIGVRNAQCGDGAVETRAGESCDDFNGASGDGCSATCDFETGAGLSAETEPNNVRTAANTATVSAGQTVTFGGTLGAGDIDWFRVDIAPGTTASLNVRTYGLLGDPASCQGDTVVNVTNSGGMGLAESDDISDMNFCSALENDPSLMNLAAGTYFVRVAGYDPQTIVPVYYLDIELQ